MEAKEQTKILLVGTERNCRSIAYVLDFKNYEYIKKLTKKNFCKYIEYQIYVCELKKKRKRLIQHKLLKENLKLQYLDDICQMIDDNEVKRCSNLKETNNQVIKPTPVQATEGVDKPKEKHQIMIVRIFRGLKHPLIAAWHVVLRLKWRLERIKKMIRKLKEKLLENEIKNYKYSKADYRHIYYIRSLSTSQLLLYVLRAPINRSMKCANLEKRAELYVHYDADVYGCCRCLLPFGNLISEADPNDILNSFRTRIIKLSSLNRSYCLCSADRCSCDYYKVDNTPFKLDEMLLPDLTLKLTLGFDKSCNLCCKSCRPERFSMNENQRQITASVTEKIIKSGWLERANTVFLAGHGEVFYSPYYRQLLTSMRRNQITIYSNGLLFNENNWKLIKDKYENISVRVSVDAATAETYKKLRGADFNILMKNLEMLGKLRAKNAIKKFEFCFVVQRVNFKELVAFVKMAYELHVDRIEFQRIFNWGHLDPQEYLENCLIINDKYLDYDLWRILQNDVFSDKNYAKIVDLHEFDRFIKASDKIYRRRYEKEQSNKL